MYFCRARSVDDEPLRLDGSVSASTILRDRPAGRDLGLLELELDRTRPRPVTCLPVFWTCDPTVLPTSLS